MASGGTLAGLWQRRRFMLIAFVAASVLAAFFLVRAIGFWLYFADHRDEPIESWMTIRYIANSWRTDPRLVRDAVGLSKDGPDRRPLERIAAERGESVDQLAARILSAIEAEREARENGKPPPPSSDAPPPKP